MIKKNKLIKIYYHKKKVVKAKKKIKKQFKKLNYKLHNRKKLIKYH